MSSTDLRARFHDGRPLDYLVTEPVLDVIVERGLYRPAQVRPKGSASAETHMGAGSKTVLDRSLGPPYYLVVGVVSPRIH